MNRRQLFAGAGAALASAVVAPVLPKPEPGRWIAQLNVRGAIVGLHLIGTQSEGQSFVFRADSFRIG